MELAGNWNDMMEEEEEEEPPAAAGLVVDTIMVWLLCSVSVEL
jgi:hypothetical protein